MTQPHQAPDAAARALLEAQAQEYGTYVAAQDIYVGTALAYAKGHPVPVSNVEQHGYAANGLVAKTSTKAGATVLDETAAAVSTDNTIAAESADAQTVKKGR